MKDWPINPRRLLIFAGIFVLVMMVVEFNSRLQELNKLTEQRQRIREQATQVMQTQFVLLTKVEWANSDQAVEAWARSDGHFLKPGDQPVVPLGEPGSTPIAVGTPTPVPTPMPSWQVWWTLFFGD
jgi:hypothetical protein